MKGAAGIHRILFLGTAGTALLVDALGWQFPHEILIILLVALVAMAGLPHGALDPIVAKKIGLWDKPAGLSAFIAVYLLIAAAALVLWLLSPGVALAVFLVYSAWHFAGDWQRNLPISWRIWPGATIVTAPAVFHPEPVESIFSILADPTTASLLVENAHWIAIPALIGTAGAALIAFRRDPWAGFELVALGTAACLLPPLAFFLLYFCGLHSPRHLIDAARGLPLSATVTTATVFTALAIALGVIAFFLLPDQSIDDSLLRITFIGLAVLTVPHMILIEHAGHRNPGNRQDFSSNRLVL